MLRRQKHVLSQSMTPFACTLSTAFSSLLILYDNLVHRIAAFAFAFAMAIPRWQWRHRCVVTLGTFLSASVSWHTRKGASQLKINKNKLPTWCGKLSQNSHGSSSSLLLYVCPQVPGVVQVSAGSPHSGSHEVLAFSTAIGFLGD